MSLISDNKPHQGAFKTHMISLAVKIAGALPLSVARALGSLLARFCWRLNDRSSQISLANIQLCFPCLTPAQQQDLARASMIETGKLAFEVPVIYQRKLTWLRRHIYKIHNENLVTEPLARDQGVILLAPHIGNWEVLSLILPSYAPMTALYQPPKRAELEPLMRAAREKAGATLVPTNRAGMATLLKSVKSGGITAILPDQNPGDDLGSFSPFFNHPAYTMTTAHGFLKRANCAVVMGMVKRVPCGFELIFLAPPKEIYDTDRCTSLAAMNKGIEMCIAQCPEQYQWEYKRFKKTPPGCEQRYSK